MKRTTVAKIKWKEVLHVTIILFSSYVEMFFSYTKSDFDCEYIALNPLIFKLVYTRHNVSSDVIARVFWRVGFGVERGHEEL